jgi:hypothetical protein
MMKDMMPGFELLQPTDVESALELLDRHGRTGGGSPADTTASIG